MEEKKKEYQLTALTAICTRDANMKEGRTINTGLLGSIRWWLEVLVRGLGGKACDPTATKCEGEKHCVVCELFGCTGWAGKFRFEVLDKDNKIQKNQIRAKDEFTLRFTPLRHVHPEEWGLLDATIRLIAEYGGLGQKLKKKHGSIKQCNQYQLMEYENAKKHVSLEIWQKPNENDFKWTSGRSNWSEIIKKLFTKKEVIR